MAGISPAWPLFYCLFSRGRREAGNGSGNGLLFHMIQPISRSTIKAIACGKRKL